MSASRVEDPLSSGQIPDSNETTLTGETGPLVILRGRLLDVLFELAWFFGRFMPGARARRIENRLEALGELVAEQFVRRSRMSDEQAHLTRMIILQQQGAFDHPASSELLAALWSHVTELPAEVARVLITEHADQLKTNGQAKPDTTTAVAEAVGVLSSPNPGGR